MCIRDRHKADVEGGTVMADGGGILGHLAVQHLIGAVALGIDGVKVAGTDAAAAALALGLVNDGLVVCIVGNGLSLIHIWVSHQYPFTEKPRSHGSGGRSFWRMPVIWI